MARGVTPTKPVWQYPWIPITVCGTECLFVATAAWESWCNSPFVVLYSIQNIPLFSFMVFIRTHYEWVSAFWMAVISALPKLMTNLSLFSGGAKSGLSTLKPVAESRQCSQPSTQPCRVPCRLLSFLAMFIGDIQLWNPKQFPSCEERQRKRLHKVL